MAADCPVIFNVNDNATAIQSGDYFDVTINGSNASAGSNLWGGDGSLSHYGALVVNVTNPAVAVPVRLLRTGADFLTINAVVPAAGRWKFEAFGQVSQRGAGTSRVSRHGMKVVATPCS